MYECSRCVVVYQVTENHCLRTFETIQTGDDKLKITVLTDGENVVACNSDVVSSFFLSSYETNVFSFFAAHDMTR